MLEQVEVPPHLAMGVPSARIVSDESPWAATALTVMFSDRFPFTVVPAVGEFIVTTGAGLLEELEVLPDEVEEVVPEVVVEVVPEVVVEVVPDVVVVLEVEPEVVPELEVEVVPELGVDVVPELDVDTVPDVEVVPAVDPEYVAVVATAVRLYPPLM